MAHTPALHPHIGQPTIITRSLSIFGLILLAATIGFIVLEFRALNANPTPPELSPTDLRTINIDALDKILLTIDERKQTTKSPTKPTNNPFLNSSFEDIE